MEKNIETEIITKLKEYNQEHLINIIQNFSKEEKEKIYTQISKIDFQKINDLYNELTVQEKVTGDDIEEIVALNKDKLSKEELEKYDMLGTKAIQSNEYALVTMSGGQGTRLGYDKPKGTFKVDISPKPKFLFEILADKLKEVNSKYNVIVPWYIMTSEENDGEIKMFFEEHAYFGYPQESIKFFKQANLPLLTEDKKLIVGKNKLVKEAADGNGGIFYSMYKNDILKDMQKNGVKWIFISSIDNILLQIADTTLVGLAIDRNTQIATKSIIRNSPEEKVGAICKKNKEIRVIEYSEMSDEMKCATNEEGELKYGESHVMCNLFSLDALNLLATKKLPYHIAHKKSEYLNENMELIKPTEPNVYKFETFIFDSWMYFDEIAILRGKREADFAPIKNKEGIDSPQTAIELYNRYFNKGE